MNKKASSKKREREMLRARQKRCSIHGCPKVRAEGNEMGYCEHHQVKLARS